MGQTPSLNQAHGNRPARERKQKKESPEHAMTAPSTQPPRDPGLLPAQDRANPIRRQCSVRNAVCRLREDSRTASRRWGAVGVRRGVCKREAIWTERVPVDLAEIIADFAIAFVRVFELQDIRRPARDRHLERVAPVARGGVSFRVCSSVCGHGRRGAAGRWVLFAYVDVGWERAFVDYQCLSWGSGTTAGGVCGGGSCGAFVTCVGVRGR